jgi:hypothetical protein
MMQWFPTYGTIRISNNYFQLGKKLYFCSVINDKDNK